MYKKNKIKSLVFFLLLIKYVLVVKVIGYMFYEVWEYSFKCIFLNNVYKCRLG